MISTSTSAGHAGVVAATIVDGSSEPAAANIIRLPFSRERYLIVQTRTDCELLRRNVNVVVESLCALNGLLENVDDRSMREGFQSRVARLIELLLLRLDQLSAADRLLQEMLPYT
ncbi:hypothetical protein ACVWXO_001874 [Bradyrhizobium sp. LM2.7]